MRRHSKYLLVLWWAVVGCGGGDNGELEDAGAQADTVRAAPRVQPLATPDAT